MNNCSGVITFLKMYKTGKDLIIFDRSFVVGNSVSLKSLWVLNIRFSA